MLPTPLQLWITADSAHSTANYATEMIVNPDLCMVSRLLPGILLHSVKYKELSELVLLVKAIELACQRLVLLTTWCTTWAVASAMKGAGLYNHIIHYTVC